LEAGRTSLVALTVAFWLVARPNVARAAPAAPEAKPGERTHDGVFLRAGVSGGPTWLDYDAPMTTGVQHEGSAQGGTGNFELSLGGTLPFGLVLGGTWFLRPLSGLEYDRAEVTRGWDSTSSSLHEVAAFARYYPFPRYGLHAEALAGVVKHEIRSERRVLRSVPPTCIIVPLSCAVEAEYETITATESSWGYAFGIGAGYDLWIGKQWSFGFTARVQAAHTWKGVRSYWFLLPTLGIGFTFH
jgi:hypothetical protein